VLRRWFRWLLQRSKSSVGVYAGLLARGATLPTLSRFCSSRRSRSHYRRSRRGLDRAESGELRKPLCGQRWQLSLALLVGYGSNRSAAYYCVARDLTERKQQE